MAGSLWEWRLIFIAFVLFVLLLNFQEVRSSRFDFENVRQINRAQVLLGQVDVQQLATPVFGFNVIVPSTMVSGIHAALTYLKTVIILDRTDVTNSLPGKFKFPNCKEPASNPNLCTAYAAEIYFDGTPIQPLDTISNVFCSAGTTDSNGTMWSIGGAASPGAGSNLQFQGVDHVRLFTPCTSEYDYSCGFTLSESLKVGSWYPAVINLADGRILVVGGANCTGAIAYNSVKYNNPTYEYLPRTDGDLLYPLELLNKNVMYNLYPHVHLLPNGLVFIFAQDWVLLNTSTNSVVKYYNKTGADIRCYPHAGSSAILPLTIANNYKAEILICGGSIADPLTYMGGVYWGSAKNTLPGSSTCLRIDPSTGSVVTEKMAVGTAVYPRVMPDLKLMADGSLEILNGASQGFGGLKNTYEQGPEHMPLTYYPNKAAGSRFVRRFTSDPTSIDRGYHTSTLLMPDGCLFISGSNPNQPPFFASPLKYKFVTELRGERYCPYYFTLPGNQPTIDNPDVPIKLKIGASFSLTGTSTTDPTSTTIGTSNFQLAAINTGFSTHSSSWGQRYVELKISSITRGGNATYLLQTKLNSNGNIMPPGLYFLYVLYAGKPCASARPLLVSPLVPLTTTVG
eukprot:TRINITY_DN16704_c0_g1_i1.p1 TRINITY_DN16704_c0_g1~~TRINITY_DN16704_c0_g1_i1.p1  ORF type:complete len:650 (-),score=136.04 TRINITY_DN16704_c0_g1_i1:184-2055(-)